MTIRCDGLAYIGIFTYAPPDLEASEGDSRHFRRHNSPNFIHKSVLFLLGEGGCVARKYCHNWLLPASTTHAFCIDIIENV